MRTQIEDFYFRSKLANAFKHTVDQNKPMGAARLVRRVSVDEATGSEMALVTTDGSLLCPDCVEENWHDISWSHHNEENDGWCPSHAVLVNRLEHGSKCGHCGMQLDWISEGEQSNV